MGKKRSHKEKQEKCQRLLDTNDGEGTFDFKIADGLSRQDFLDRKYLYERMAGTLFVYIGKHRDGPYQKYPRQSRGKSAAAGDPQDRMGKGL